MKDKENINNQEYYNNIMTEELSNRVIQLRDKEGVRWKDMTAIIKKEFGDEYALVEDTITGMYLEYSARDFIDKD